MNKNEFMSPRWDKYNSIEMDEIKALRKIVFHLIREIHILRETSIQSSRKENVLAKDATYGKIYKEICVLSYNSAGPTSGEDKILSDWFDNIDGLPDEVIMLRKLGYNESEINEYLKKIDEFSCYT
jgi:hypothetical protein